MTYLKGRESEEDREAKRCRNVISGQRSCGSNGGSNGGMTTALCQSNTYKFYFLFLLLHCATLYSSDTLRTANTSNPEKLRRASLIATSAAVSESFKSFETHLIRNAVRERKPKL